MLAKINHPQLPGQGNSLKVPLKIWQGGIGQGFGDSSPAASILFLSLKNGEKTPCH